MIIPANIPNKTARRLSGLNIIQLKNNDIFIINFLQVEYLLKNSYGVIDP